MLDIQRYDLLEVGGRCAPEEIKLDDGDWVKYEDYEDAIEILKSHGTTKIMELENDVEDLKATLKGVALMTQSYAKWFPR